MSLREKTISGIFWSFVDFGLTKFVTFVVGIVLARLLEPRDFGLVGLLIVFIEISSILVDSGFRDALIRKTDIKDSDFNTVFFFNIFISVIIFFILFLSANLIASFFGEPSLVNISRVLFLIIIINSLSLIHEIQLTKNLKIKPQTKISLISNISSGFIAIGLAYFGFGLWSLVFRYLLNSIIKTTLLWIINNWKPKKVFSYRSFEAMFKFSSMLLFTSLINKIFENVYYFIIAKFFSPTELGFYSRADLFAKLPTSNIDAVVQRISYPVLSKIQNDNLALKSAVKKLTRTTMLVTFSLMFILIATSEEIILLLIGPKWEPSISYLQLLSFAYIFYPAQVLNLNLINIKGRSDITLKLALIKKVLIIPIILIGIFISIKAMILGIAIHSIIAFTLNNHYANKFINYNLLEIISDLFKSLLITVFSALFVYMLAEVLKLNTIYGFIFKVFFYFGFIIYIFEKIREESYLEIKNIFLERFRFNRR